MLGQRDQVVGPRSGKGAEKRRISPRDKKEG